MAGQLKGTFLADFSSFSDAVKQADSELKGLETGSNQVATALNRLTNSFGGNKLAQDANLTVEAITRLGGATTLTANEQKKVNAQLTEAIAKYTALGKVAPQAMLDLQKATAAANTEAQKTSGAGSLISQGLKAIGPAVVAAFSIGAVVRFGKELLDTADHLQLVSDQLSISTDEVQKLEYIAGQSGNTLDQMTTALSFMQEAIGSESKGLLGVLGPTGDTLEELKTQSPYEQMATLAGAIAKIEDPAERAAAATDAFGKTGRAVMPTLLADFEALGNEAPKMSDATVKALDRTGDAISTFFSRVKNAAADQVGYVVSEIDRISAELKDNAATAERWANKVGLSFNQAAADIRDVNEAWNKLSKGMITAAPTAPKAPGDLFKPDKLTAPPIDAAAEEAALNKRRDALDANAESAKKLKAAQDEIFGVNLRAAVDLQIKALGSLSNLVLLSTEQQGGLNAKIGEAIGTLTRAGKVVPDSYKAWYTATAEAAAETKKLDLSLFNLKGTVQTIPAPMMELSDATAATVENLKLIPVQTRALTGLKDATREYGDQARWAADFQKKLNEQQEEAAKKSALFKSNLDSLANSMAQLAQISGPTWAGIVGGLGSIVGSASAVSKSFDLIKSSSGLMKTDVLSGLTGMASGITGIVQAAMAAVQGIQAIWKAFDRNKGRDVVVDFADTFGGFDQLHEKLLVLGDAGEALWIKLTQGVGRNNPAQAQKVVDEVSAALEEQARKQTDVISVTEEQAQATIESASQAAKALEELAPRLKDNEAAWQAWGDFVAAQITRIAGELRAIALPTLGGAAATQPPIGATPGAAGAGGAGAYQTTILLDGDVIARSTARRMPRVLQTVGV